MIELETKKIVVDKDSVLPEDLEIILSYQRKKKELEALEAVYSSSIKQVFSSLQGEVADIKNFHVLLEVEGETLYSLDVAHTKENVWVRKDYESAVIKKRKETREAVKELREYNAAIAEEASLERELSSTTVQTPSTSGGKEATSLPLVVLGSKLDAARRTINGKVKKKSYMSTFNLMRL